MSEQDTMRLVTEVVDKFSGPLKSMNEQLKQLGQQLKKTHDDGKKNTSEHAKVFAQFRDQLINFKQRGIDVAKPALEGLGVAAFATAGGIAAAGAAVSKATMDWASFGQQLTMANRASGLTIDTLRGLADANERFGVSQEHTISALENFGEHMNELHRRSPAYINMWKALGGNAWAEVGSKLMQLDGNREAQLREAMKIIPTIRDVDQRRRVLALLGLPENWATLTAQEMQKMRQQGEQFAKSHPIDVGKAYKAQQAWEALRSTIRGMWSDLGNNVGSAMFDGFKWIADHQSNFQAVADAFKGMSGSAFSFSSDIKDIESIGHIFESMASASGTLKSDLQDLTSIGEALKGAWEWLGDTFKNILKGKVVLGDHETSFAQQNNAVATRDQQEKTQESVKKGVTEGMTDFWNFLKSVSEASQAMGANPMAYHPGGAGGARMWYGNEGMGVGGAGSGVGGSVPKSMGKGEDGSSTPLDANGNLADQRSRFATELQNNPALRNKVLRIAANEQGRNPAGTQGVIESMMNRALVRGTTLEKQAQWFNRATGTGYYEPGSMGRGALENPRSREILENSLKNALSGSDIVAGATDNSSGKLAAREKATRSFRWLRDLNGESFFAPGWQEKKQADRWDKWHEQMNEMSRRGPRPPPDAELLRRGGNMINTSLEGNASLDITLNGFPRGTRTSHRADGMFKSVTLSRGRPMNMAQEV